MGLAHCGLTRTKIQKIPWKLSFMNSLGVISEESPLFLRIQSWAVQNAHFAKLRVSNVA